MYNNYLDERSRIDLQTKNAFIKSINTVNKLKALGESDITELQGDVENTLMYFKNWIIENSRLLEKVSSMLQKLILKYPLSNIKTNNAKIYKFSSPFGKTNMEDTIVNIRIMLEELNNGDIEDIDFSVYTKVVERLIITLYNNKLNQYLNFNGISAILDNDISQKDTTTKSSEPSHYNSVLVYTNELTTEIEGDIYFINKMILALLGIHTELINLLTDSFVSRVNNSNYILKLNLLLSVILQRDIDFNISYLFKLVNMTANNLKNAVKEEDPVSISESYNVEPESKSILDKLGINDRFRVSPEFIELNNEPDSLPIIAASESSRLFKNILVEDLYMDKITNIYNYVPSGELGPIKKIGQAVDKGKSGVVFATRGLQDLIKKVIEMIKNLFKGVAVEEKKLKKYAKDIKSALDARGYNGKNKKVKIYTVSDLANAGLTNKKNGQAMIFANRIEQDKKENTSNKVDFSSEDSVHRTLSSLIKNFDKMKTEDFNKSVRNLFNYVDVDIDNAAKAQQVKTAMKNTMKTENDTLVGKSKNFINKKITKKSLTYTNVSGEKAYSELVDSLNMLYILADGFSTLKGTDYLVKEQRNMTKLSNQLNNYLKKTSTKTGNNFMQAEESYLYDPIGDAISAYAEGIGDTMTASTGVPSVGDKVSVDTSNSVPTGDLEKEVEDPKDSDEKQSKKVTKIDDLGEYSKYVKSFIVNYSSTVNYNMMFYKQFLNNLIKATVDNLTAFYAISSSN